MKIHSPTGCRPLYFCVVASHHFAATSRDRDVPGRHVRRGSFESGLGWLGLGNSALSQCHTWTFWTPLGAFPMAVFSGWKISHVKPSLHSRDRNQTDDSVSSKVHRHLGGVLMHLDVIECYWRVSPLRKLSHVIVSICRKPGRIASLESFGTLELATDDVLFLFFKCFFVLQCFATWVILSSSCST